VNAFIVVVGDFKKEDLLPRLRRPSALIGRGGSSTGEGPGIAQVGERRILVKREAQLPSIVRDTTFQTSGIRTATYSKS